MAEHLVADLPDALARLDEPTGETSGQARPAAGFAASYRSFRRRWDLEALDFDPAELLDSQGDSAPRRDFSW